MPAIAKENGSRRRKKAYRQSDMIQNATMDGSRVPSSFLPKIRSDHATSKSPRGGFSSRPRFRKDQIALNEGKPAA